MLPVFEPLAGFYEPVVRGIACFAVVALAGTSIVAWLVLQADRGRRRPRVQATPIRRRLRATA
jgi:hypothetical protein